MNMNTETSLTKNSLGIRARLFLSFAIIIVILAVAVSLVLVKISSSEKSAKQTIALELPTYDAYLNLDIQIYHSLSALNGWLLTRDTKFKEEFTSSWGELNHLITRLDNYSPSWDAHLQEQWKNAKSYINQIQTLQFQLLNSSAQDTASSTLLTSTVMPLINKTMDIIDGSMTTKGDREGGIFDYQLNKLNAGTNTIITNIHTIKLYEYILFAFIFFTSIIIAIVTANKILNLLIKYSLHSSKVAGGDLTQRLSITNNDEIGKLGHDLNTMTEGLSSITKNITEACHNMVSMLSQVKNAVDSQSAGASEQASSINQITASLEEIEKSSTQTMQKAKTLGDVAERTRSKGELGLNSVEQSVNGMKVVRDKVQVIAQTILDLSNQTQQVGEITAVVNTLAQQSKMLALNASIEAAKAGDAGKGFAVVAAEVKNLAEQSEQSTTQVQKILEDIRHATEKAVMATEEGTKGVDVGTTLVEQTDEVVRSLNEVIHEATIASQQIEAAIRQESIGLEQITAGMNEINQVTSSSVASVKQTTEAIENLGTIALNLKKYTDVYKV